MPLDLNLRLGPTRGRSVAFRPNRPRETGETAAGPSGQRLLNHLLDAPPGCKRLHATARYRAKARTGTRRTNDTTVDMPVAAPAVKNLIQSGASPEPRGLFQPKRLPGGIPLLLTWTIHYLRTQIRPVIFVTLSNVTHWGTLPALIDYCSIRFVCTRLGQSYSSAVCTPQGFVVQGVSSVE